MKIVVAAALAVALTAPAYAQDALAGTYTGRFAIPTSRGDFEIGVTLVIADVKDGKLTGTGTFHTGTCRGDYPVQGGVKGDGIGVISTQKAGPAGDCTFGFRGTIQGNQLVGKMGAYDVVLRR